MNKEELIEIYIEVSNKLCNGTEWCWAGVGEPLQLFAKLVAEKEREAIWNILFEYAGRDDLTPEDESLLKHLADLIQARGQE